MSAVARTLWLIESRFRDPPSLDEMAEHAGISRSHLSRSFPAATGLTISSYIRGRRLTEAARLLANGAPDILAVALDAGYGSHEAFTRAFRDQFALTPEELRRRGTLANLSLVESRRMDPERSIILPPPVIEARPALHLAGFRQHFDMRTLAQIPEMWARFGPHVDAVFGRNIPDTFGICGQVKDDGFDYACAMPVRPGDSVHPDLTVIDLPPARYARFRHEGHISEIRSTCGAIFEDWLPQTHETHAPVAFNFLEYYSPAFDPAVGIGGVEIWLPLAP